VALRPDAALGCAAYCGDREATLRLGRWRANERLRQRGLGHKPSLDAREYALGVEALERAARGEPLLRIYERVFAVLALKSEPVDPRLQERVVWRSCGWPCSHTN
jgi:hypothetical protein